MFYWFDDLIEYLFMPINVALDFFSDNYSDLDAVVFKIGFGQIEWLDMPLGFLFRLVYLVFIFVVVVLFLYKFIKWLFSIPKRLGGIK